MQGVHEQNLFQSVVMEEIKQTNDGGISSVIFIDKKLIDVVVSEGKSFGTEAQMYAQKFSDNMNIVNTLSAPLATMDKANPTPAMAKAARAMRLQLIPNRTETARKVKEEIHTINLKSEYVKSLGDVIINASKITEDEYSKIEKHFETQEKERKQKLYDERFVILSEVSDNASMYPLGDFTQVQFDELHEFAKKTFEDKKAAEAKAAEEQKERERAEALLAHRQEIITPLLKYHNINMTYKPLALNSEEGDFQYAIQVLEAAKVVYKAEQEVLRKQQEAADELKKNREELQAKRLNEMRPYIAFYMADITKLYQLTEEVFKGAVLFSKEKLDEKEKKDKAEKEKSDQLAKDLEAEKQKSEKIVIASIKDPVIVVQSFKEAPEVLIERNSGVVITEMTEKEKAFAFCQDLEILKYKYKFETKRYKDFNTDMGIMIDKMVKWAMPFLK